MAGRASLGRAGEEQAARFLQARGLTLVARNWRCRFGEIDLVALDGSQVVFVEVKTRTGTAFGTPAEAVDGRKQARLARLASAFLQERGWWHRPVRFDVVAVGPAPAAGADWPVDWIQDAFRM